VRIAACHHVGANFGLAWAAGHRASTPWLPSHSYYGRAGLNPLLQGTRLLANRGSAEKTCDLIGRSSGGNQHNGSFALREKLADAGQRCSASAIAVPTPPQQAMAAKTASERLHPHKVTVPLRRYPHTGGDTVVLTRPCREQVLFCTCTPASWAGTIPRGRFRAWRQVAKRFAATGSAREGQTWLGWRCNGGTLQTWRSKL